MLFSDVTGRKVVSTATAETVGKIDDFVADPATRTILALVLKKTDEGKVLRWSAITAFGVETITALAGKEYRLLGKRVLTAAGDEIGSVEDVEFDADTGQITRMHLTNQQVEGVRLRGLGSYAVVIDAHRLDLDLR